MYNNGHGSSFPSKKKPIGNWYSKFVCKTNCTLHGAVLFSPRHQGAMIVSYFNINYKHNIYEYTINMINEGNKFSKNFWQIKNKT